MRWSLRRHRRRAEEPAPGTIRLDPVRPELGPAPPGGCPPDAPAPGGRHGYAPGGHRAEARRPDAYAPGHAAGRPPGRTDEMRPASGRRAGPDPFPAGRRPADATAPIALPSQGGAWPEVMERFGLNLLTLAEQLRMSLDELEADEGDPDRLQKLYRVDHAVTRMRRASRDLRTLAGRAADELSGADTPLLDVIRVALSAIERYTSVTIGRVADFGVLGYAADDVASLLAALLDNATRYSPGVTSVSAHLTEGGSVLFRISDGGIGMDPDGVAALNAMLAGDVPGPDDRTARHTGFPVVHRLARKHSIGVRLAARPAPGSGTIALVTVPPELMCELPDDLPQRPPAPPHAPAPGGGNGGRAAEGSVSVLRAPRRTPAPAAPPSPPSGTAYGPDAGTREPAGADDPLSGLPRREPASLRGSGARGGSGPAGPGDAGRPPAPSAEQLAASRHAFADDLSAFSLGLGPGSPGADGPETPDPGQPDPETGKGAPSLWQPRSSRATRRTSGGCWTISPRPRRESATR